MLNRDACSSALTVATPLQVPAFERAVQTAGDDLGVAAEELGHHHRAAVAGQRVLSTEERSGQPSGQVRSVSVCCSHCQWTAAICQCKKCLLNGSGMTECQSTLSTRPEQQSKAH